MTSIFAAISYIKTVSGTSALAGVATYRCDENEFVDYNYKAFTLIKNQNAFALTIHKTQGLTLPHSTLTIDENMFAAGQIYVAMSRAPSWDSLDIFDFDFDALKVDKNVINEYKRLKLLNQKGLKEMR